MLTVEDYIFNKEEKQREILLYLYSVLTNYENIKTKVSWSLPFFLKNRDLCYLKAVPKNGIEIVFMQAIYFKKELQKTLSFKNRKQVGGLSYYSIEEIDEVALKEIIAASIEIDETRTKSKK